MFFEENKFIIEGERLNIFLFPKIRTNFLRRNNRFQSIIPSFPKRETFIIRHTKQTPPPPKRMNFLLSTVRFIPSYTKSCSINGDNVYRGINTAVGISNACSRSFRLAPATNVFLRSCTRIRYIRPPIRGGITRCLRSIRRNGERERERERMIASSEKRPLFPSPFSFLSFLVHSFLRYLSPSQRHDIAGFHFAIHSRVALETRGKEGGEEEKGRGNVWKTVVDLARKRFVFVETTIVERWRMRPRRRRRRRPSIYKTHERETHGRTLIATGRNATRGWLIARVGWATFQVTYRRYSFWCFACEPNPVIFSFSQIKIKELYILLPRTNQSHIRKINFHYYIRIYIYIALDSPVFLKAIHLTSCAFRDIRFIQCPEGGEKKRERERRSIILFVSPSEKVEGRPTSTK